MVIKLGPPMQVLESSTRISKFYDSTDSEHKFHKTGHFCKSHEKTHENLKKSD